MEKTRRGEKEDGESISTAEKGIIYAAGAYTMWESYQSIGNGLRKFQQMKY